MAEGGGLLNRYTGKPVSRVRIPSSPPFSALVNQASCPYVESTSELEIMIAMDLTLAATDPLVLLQDVLFHACIHHPVQSVLVDT